LDTRGGGGGGPALVAALVLVLTAAGWVGWFAPWGPSARRDPADAASSAGKPLPLPDKPSIAVLPFDNLGGDPERLGLGEGLAENIISSLSKIPKMFVISRSSTFTYKGKPVKVDQISQELGVRYVLAGSVQKSGTKVRITAELVDGVSGFHMWSETYDRDLDDIFALQDEITLNVVTALQIELTQGELTRVRQRGTTNLKAWLLVNESFEQLMRFTRDGNAQARKLAEDALALDPGYPEAYVRLARTYLSDFQMRWGASPTASLERSIELAQQALALDASYPDTYILLSAIYLYLKRHDDAMLAISKALDLSPNHPLAKAHLGMILTYGGQPEAAINVFKEAMRLSPIYPDWFLSELARAYFLTGRYDEATDALQQRLQRDPTSGEALILLAASESAAGRMDTARDALGKFLEPRPAYTLSQYASGEFYKSPDNLKPVLDALRKAGLPD
jgi:adenylate cyclase